MKIDIASETWAEVRKLCHDRIAARTDQIVSSPLREADYASLRGEIAAYRDILRLADTPKIEATDHSKRTDRSGI